MPMTLEQYNISQLHIVALLSKLESTGDTSIEIKENADYDHEIFGKCRKTVKIMNINSKTPAVIKTAMPSPDALKLIETAYNAFPKCNTTYINKYFSESTMKITVDSFHKEGCDFEENALNVPEKIYKKTKIKFIDISKDANGRKYDPSQNSFSMRLSDGSEAVVGPLKEDWIEDCKKKNIPLMTCYKQVMIESNKFGIGWIAYIIESELHKIFMKSHQQMFYEMKNTFNLNIEDIRNIEEQTKKDLEARNE